jgi:hypothetical protein
MLIAAALPRLTSHKPSRSLPQDLRIGLTPVFFAAANWFSAK